MIDINYSIDIMSKELKNKYICPEVKYAFSKSIQALEKQLRKVIEYDKNGENECPVCRSHVYTDDNYCFHCGQKIFTDLNNR